MVNTVPSVPNTEPSIQDIRTAFDRHTITGEPELSLDDFYLGALNQKGRVYHPNGIPTSGTISINDFRGASYWADVRFSTFVGKNAQGDGYAYGYHSGFDNCSTAPPTYGTWTPTDNPLGEVVARATVYEAGSSDPNRDALNVGFTVGGPIYHNGYGFRVYVNGLNFHTSTADLFGYTDCEGYQIFRAQWTNIDRALWATRWADLFETNVSWLIEEE